MVMRASPETCRAAEAGRWHHGLGKESWHPPPLGFAPGVILPLGSWDMPWPRHLGVSWAKPWGTGIEAENLGL